MLTIAPAAPCERIIPHSEHPEAYGSTKKHRVKFIEPYLLSSHRQPASRKSSDASMAPITAVSSAASVFSMSSLGSPNLSARDGSLRDESRRHEYDFENEEGRFGKRKQNSPEAKKTPRLLEISRTAHGTRCKTPAPSPHPDHLIEAL